MGAEPPRSPAADDDDAALFSPYVCSLIGRKVRKLCHRPAFPPSERDDLVQHLKMQVLRKAPQFDPSRGASFDTFADRVVVSAVKMLVRDRDRQKRAAGFAAASLERTTVDVGGTHVTLREGVSDEDHGRRLGNAGEDGVELRERDRLVAGAVAALPPHLAEVARRLMAGESVASIARGTGMSRRRAAAAVGAIRRHFEARGLGETK